LANESSQLIEESWISTSIERIQNKFLEVKEKYPFKWELKTYWETDQLGLLCFEEPQEMPTPFGMALLSGNRHYQNEGRLVFHPRHVVSLQFIRIEGLRHLFESQEIFGDEGPLRFELECEEIKPIQNFCREMNATIHRESIGLRDKRVRNIFERIALSMESKDCDSRLKSRFYYLKELMDKFRKNPILYRPELERMKLL
jgi:hypothetical protein